MNLIKIYGDLKYKLANIENNLFQCGGSSQDYFHEFKVIRLIQLIEYRFKIIDWKPCDKKRLFEIKEQDFKEEDFK